MRGSVNVPGAFGRERIEAEKVLEARIASAEKTLNGLEKIPGSAPPTLQVTAQVGQIYIDVDTGDQWKCIAVNDSGTAWERLEGSTVSLTAADVGAVPDTRKVNGKALNADISLTPSDVGAATLEHSHTASQVGAAPAVHTHTRGQITDFPASMPASDVHPWAKEPQKPAYTAAEVGAAAAGHTHTAAQVGAKVSTWSAFHAGPSAPSDTTQLWIDTTADTGGLKYWNGSAWAHVPMTPV